MTRSPAWVAAALLLLISSAKCFSGDKTESTVPTANQTYCLDLQPQVDLDLQQIAKKWFVVQIIKHKIDPVHPTTSLYSSIETCPIVKIRFTSDTSLRLLWTEKAGNVEYSFVVDDIRRAPGVWISRDLQNGTLVSKQYTQFAGKVQVMKAVATHMVLTFCSTTPDNTMYSMLLSDEPDLPESDKIGVKNLLMRKFLPIANVQETCRNSGPRVIEMNWRIMTGLALAALILAQSSTTTRHALGI